MAYDWRIWNVFSHAVIPDWKRIRSRFPLELDRETILCPHLYGFETSATAGGDDRYYTETNVPTFAVFAGARAEHLAFLRDEVAPRIAGRIGHVVVVDIGAFAYEEHLPGGAVGRRGVVSELPALLNGWLGEPFVLPHGLDPLAHPLLHADFASRGRKVRGDVLAAMSEAPLRLWEAFLLRGPSYRWELIDGEVPLVGPLPTPLLANRSLLQCVADAEALEGIKAADDGGWIRVGRYRFRQVESLLEIRVRMSPADIRVAFMPAHREPASDALPSLAGVMLAGGPKGKTEMLHGYTDSTVCCKGPDEVERLAASLRETLLERCGVPAVHVHTRSDDWHAPPSESLGWGIECHERYLTLETPTFRGGRSPLFDVLHGDYWEDDPAPPIAFIHRIKDESSEASGAERQQAFEKGSREVWVIDHGDDPHVAVFRTPDQREIYRGLDIIPASETFPRDVPVTAFLRGAREDEMLEMLLARKRRG